MRTRRHDRKSASFALTIAALAGLLHAAASMYWALGGRWQLESVGDWAVRLANDHPITAGIGLGALAVVKAAAAVGPLASDRWRTIAYLPVRVLSWVGAWILLAWGGVSTLSAWAVLSGVVTPTDGYDRATMLGHGIVWDPLFVIWGGALIVGLWCSRRTVDATVSQSTSKSSSPLA